MSSEHEMMEGTFDAEKKALTLYSEVANAMEGNAIEKHKSVVTFVDDNTHTMVMYKLEGGKEIKMMELEYKRRK